MTTKRIRVQTLVFAVLCAVLALAAACSKPPARKEFSFRGVVERVDTGTNTMAVNGEDVPGWMMGMTMTYGVDKPDVIQRVKVGDHITAKVFEGDTKTLYDVQVAK